MGNRSVCPSLSGLLYARQAGVRHRWGCVPPPAQDRRPLPLSTVPVGMATDNGKWHPGKYRSKAACCASTTATSAVSSAGAAAGSTATQTRAMGGKAAHAAEKSRRKAMQLLMDGLVRPVAMPFQLVGSGARVASLEALAATPNPMLTLGRDA